MADHANIACSEVWGGNRAAAVALVVPGLEGWVVSRPWDGAEAGGDVHYVSSCGTGRITRLMLADVAGHGDSAAELGGQLRGLMQRYLNHIDPFKLAARMNRDLVSAGDSAGRFATALVMTFFSPDGGLSICNAGHPPPLLYRVAEGAWSVIDQPDTGRSVANLPLGVLEEVGYAGRELKLEPGDWVLAYTDCLTEAANADGRQLGRDGLVDLVNGLDLDPALAGPGPMVDAILAAIADAGYTTDDDLTAVAIRCTQRSGGVGVAGMVKGVFKSFTAPLRGVPFPWPEIGSGRPRAARAGESSQQST